MNKTLKTVLITLGATFVVLFAVVMIFGEDTSTPARRTDDIKESASISSQESPSELASSIEIPAKIIAPESPAVEVSEELLKATLAYDIFDWNMASEPEKVEISKTIMSIWDTSGGYYEMSAEDLAAYIDQNLYDQANIFEVACVAAQIDPLPYFDSIS
ncbi:MAG TPA: hypothetical protein VN626_10770 [Clostridia bacterium]|nr:hypothetical protein [Clostridia bacterium]